MKKFTYLAVFEKSETGFGVYFPDVPGCISCGDDFDHALRMAKEALGLHLYGMERDGDSMPERTDAMPEIGPGDLAVSVSVYPDLVREEIRSRREKTTITIPRWLKIEAEAEGLNFSRLLEAALKERLGIAS
ncbi:MAG: type II toxin-antitoxin system HicB family antitoxin [Treponema sp.]|nr:type II toxin-antitoxin system HicB family antitoxin [Treponema sp.]